MVMVVKAKPVASGSVTQRTHAACNDSAESRVEVRHRSRDC